MQTAHKLIPEQTFALTPKQVEARDLCASDAMYVLLYGGARSAKTFSILRIIVNRALLAPGSRHVVLRLRFNHVKASVIFDTFPKVMDLCFPNIEFKLSKSEWFAKFENGSEIWFGGLDDKERTDKILGNEYVSIFINECSQVSYDSYLTVLTRLAQKVTYRRGNQVHDMRLKMYLDENPPTRGHWSHKIFIERTHPDSRKLIADAHLYASLLMNPTDNLENLPAAYVRSLETMPKRQRDRFFLGLFGSLTENALWTGEVIESSKVDGEDLPQFVRVVVSVDPSGASEDENVNNDDIGIVVVALGVDGIGYLLEDLTLKAGPKTWGDVVRDAYQRHEADRVIGEANYGGAMVEYVIKADNPNISYKAITASRGKMLRAEPVSALHEIGKIRFDGDFPELEDELLACTTSGYTGPRSPNRLDAFVFAMTELFPAVAKGPQETRRIIFPPNLRRF